ncbi:MAG: hypothetical protein GWN73_39845 [Actinobacteria bacterium]|nr:hypothetical protein [Actinomycetota bacterium]
MSTTTELPTEPPEVTELAERLDELEAQLAEFADEQDQLPKMDIIAIHGTLDMAYPTLILSSVAAAFDWDVTVFASFWALDLLHEEKSKRLKISALGNPAIPMPNLLAVLPGGDRLATAMMRRQIAGIGTETVDQLIRRAMDAGVRFQACGMAMELMGYEPEDFIEGVETDVGAGTALLDMADSDIQLVI